MKLVELEVERQDWNSVRCGCGHTASHVEQDLLWLANGGDGGRLIDVRRLDGHVLMPSVLCEPAVPVMRVTLSVLSDDVSVPVRRAFSEIALRLVAGEGQTKEAASNGRDLVNECIAIAREGIWLFYSEILSGRDIDTASNVYEALTLIEKDTDRLSRVQAVLGENLSWDLR